MSEEHPQGPVARYRWIAPAWFLGGLLLGLILLGWAGRRIARTDYHPGFVRFPPSASPESRYFPTVNEMAAIVRGQCRPDQVLVIVGGNSVLLGVGQPVGEVWTKHLQDLLGDKYCVINFAFRGASPTNGGAVIAEVLRNEFPHQIYIADEAELTAVPSIGNDTYRYLNWQAYFGGKLINYPLRNATIAGYRARADGRPLFIDAAISAIFDRVLYYKDLWNWVTFCHFGTIDSLYGAALPDLAKPRAEIPDDERDSTNPDLVARRYSAAGNDIEMKITRGYFEIYSHRQPDGHWQLADATRIDLQAWFKEAFPTPLKARTLMLIARGSPHYRRQLSPEEAVGEDQAFKDTVALWREAGYSAMEFGREFNEDDYVDRIHLTKLGGAKLAAAVAPQVQEMARQLGYLR
jgi:hypothetical protein